MKTILEILAAGEYDYDVKEYPLDLTVTRGLWIGYADIRIHEKETIHGNSLQIKVDWLQIGATGKTVTEEFVFMAHGRRTKVTADRMIEELRKHI